MKMFSNTIKCAAGLAVSLTLLSGCAINMPVPVKDPVQSSVSYSKSGSLKPVTLAFKDEQSVDDKAKLLTGTIPMQMLYDGKPFDAVPWISKNTVKELSGRGLPVSLASDSTAGTGVVIKRVHIENHRVNGFSPFVTFTSMRADLMTDSGPQRVTAYIKRGKVPVWSFDEVIEPTYNEPLALLTKELAAKLNQQLFKQMVGNEQVNSLIAKIEKSDDKQGDTYLDVYQLGFSNNPAAIPTLVKLSTHSNEYVRLAAISSLGILKAVDQTDFLVGLYEATGNLWQDRAMALKAIGDMGTPKSREYLQKQWDNLQNRTDKDALWTKEIIALYL
jgi:hypothetical protein